jgi:phage terminase small subunit
MTPRQQRFLDEYLVDLNGYRAAKRAGYAEGGARNVASQLLKKPEIAAAVARAQQERRERLRITADRVLSELARIAFADIGRLVTRNEKGLVLKDTDDLSPDDLAAVSTIEVSADGKGRIRLHSKLRALDAIARHLGLFAPSAAETHGTIPRPQQNGLTAREILRRKLAQLAGEPVDDAPIEEPWREPEEKAEG